MKRLNSKVATSAILLAATSLLFDAQAAGDERRGLDAHEHGVTTLNIALDDDLLVIELFGPAMNFVGFEYAPTSSEDKQTVATALETLRTDATLIELNSSSGCARDSANAQHISSKDDEHSHNDHEKHDSHHDKHHDDNHSANGDTEHQCEHDSHASHDDDHEKSERCEHDKQANHSEFEARFTYRCRNPGQLDTARVNVFERFPLTTEIEASFIGPDVQTFKNLTPSDPILNLDR